MKPITFILSSTLLLLTSNGLAQQVYDGKSPSWLAAVGKLTVPGQTWDGSGWSHLREHCSATLLRRPTAARAQYLLSAWHCVEHYRDLSYDIEFELPGSSRVRRARLVTSGGSMDADWALLKLVAAVPTAGTASLVVPTHMAPSDSLVMAGYSSGALGKLGSAPLSYDRGCQVLHRDGLLVTTDCQASKGASGGPVVSELGGNVRLLGVVSSGDGAGRSLYVPLTVFASVLRQYL